MTKRNVSNSSSPVLDCNYSNNYYGDQVCVLKKS